MCSPLTLSPTLSPRPPSLVGATALDIICKCNSEILSFCYERASVYDLVPSLPHSPSLTPPRSLPVLCPSPLR